MRFVWLVVNGADGTRFCTMTRRSQCVRDERPIPGGPTGSIACRHCESLCFCHCCMDWSCKGAEAGGSTSSGDVEGCRLG